MIFRGTGTALITPFKRDGSIDESSLRNLVEFQINGNVDAILPTGTTGEGATLTEDEQLKVIEIVVSQNNGRKKIIAGTGTNSTQKTIFLSRKAKKIGVDGVLIVSPYYNKPTQDGIFKHIESIASNVDIPIIIYNVPGRTSSNIIAETTLKISELIPNVCGVKEASGNFSQIMEILKNRKNNFAVYSGDDAITLPMISLGSDGVISVVSNQIPSLFSQMVNFCLEGNFTEAKKIHFKILSLMEFNFIESNPIPVKASLFMMNLIENNLRLPLLPLSEKYKNKLQQILKELDII